MLTYCCLPFILTCAARCLLTKCVFHPDWANMATPHHRTFFFTLKTQSTQFNWPPYCTASDHMSERETPDLELIGARVHRLYLAVQRVVLSVQGMLLTVLTGLHHLHCDLDVTQRLRQRTCLINAQHHKALRTYDQVETQLIQ